MAMLETIRAERIEKAETLRKKGINPYPSKSARTHTALQITDDFSKLEGKTVTVSGRIMSWRDFGKLAFANLKDGSGQIQLYIKEVNLKDEWKSLSLYDIGDFVDATGTVTKTKTGEISVEASSLHMLAKSVRPLPEKWLGLKHDDARFRQRYLDFLVNPGARERIEKRAELLRYIREFMWDRGFIEIENPSLEINPAGAEARPFITHINAYDLDVYLRICAGELWQKMSTIGGFEKVFEVARVYRNEGVDSEHNPEFTMIEFYWAYATIEDNIALHQELFSGMAKKLTGSYIFTYRGKKFDLTPPFPIIRYTDLFKKHTGLELESFDRIEDLKEAGKKLGVKLENEMGWSSTIDQIYKEQVRPKVIGPVFLIDYPYVLTPLAKRIETDGRYVQMSQLLLDSMEMCRIYGELNDPVDQKQRFDEQEQAREGGDEQTWGSDDDFVEAMEYGMPPQTGSGIGIDRWVKLLTDAESLREVIAYPIVKPEQEGSSDARVAERMTGKLAAGFDELLKAAGINYEDVKIAESDGDEYLSMADDFKQTYPTAVSGYAIIEGVTVKQSDPALNKLKYRILKELRGLTKADIDLNKNIMSYRLMYQEMGVDYHSRRPSPEALLRRISQGRELYTVNTMVDAYNLVVMSHQVSVGTFDLDHMKLPIVLQRAKGGEKIELIGGEVKDIAPGEVFYADAEGAYNLDYNYRDSERTKTRLESSRIMINAEGVGTISFDQVKKTMQLTVAVVLAFCGGKLVRTGIIRAS